MYQIVDSWRARNVAARCRNQRIPRWM